MKDETEILQGPSDVVWLRDEAAAVEVLERAVGGLWDVVAELTRLRRTQRENYRVSIFGSARTAPGVYPYDEVKRLAAELTRLGCDIITGGGPGLMRAANEGAMSIATEKPERSIGVRIHLPFEQEVNPFVGEVYEHKTFFSRLHHFVIASDAFVVVPGGIGTLLELTMVWQLLQVRNLHGTPLVVVGKMWRELAEWARTYMLRPGLEVANPEDVAILQCVDGVDETVAIVRAKRDEWLREQAARATS
jgi:uncharacterized protein (TIGR00730 family)